MLKKEKMDELSLKDPDLKQYYQLQDNGFYKVRNLEDTDKGMLKEKFRRLGFSALNFTDSRSIYQFYPLKRLWSDIHIAIDHDIKLWHPATEPISAGELYKYLTGEEFINELPGMPADYDFRTVYDAIFGGGSGYICNKKEVLRRVKEYVEQ